MLNYYRSLTLPYRWQRSRDDDQMVGLCWKDRGWVMIKVFVFGVDLEADVWRWSASQCERDRFDMDPRWAPSCEPYHCSSMNRESSQSPGDSMLQHGPTKKSARILIVVCNYYQVICQCLFCVKLWFEPSICIVIYIHACDWLILFLSTIFSNLFEVLLGRDAPPTPGNHFGFVSPRAH